jgi:predicted dinucleotide-binding enzyme
MNDVKTIGILGAGRVGTAIARRAIAAGYEVRIATAKPASELKLLVSFVAPGAIAGDANDVIAASDVVVLALPLSKYRSLDPKLLAGKIVIDAMNYWSQTEGALPEFEKGQSSTEVVAGHLQGARIVRSFNHMGYHEIDGEARPAGAPDRRALAVAGDDADARRIVERFVDRIGFDPVDAGPLAAARSFDIGTPVFGAPLTSNAMREALALRLAA